MTGLSILRGALAMLGVVLEAYHNSGPEAEKAREHTWLTIISALMLGY